MLLEFYICKRHIEDKAKTRWYYSHLPKHVITAFTLAEVLITLLIVGIVASLVIPEIIQNTQNAEYTTKLEKAFGTLNNGFKLIKANSGCNDMVCTGILNSSTSITLSNIVNTGVFNVIKSCNKNVTGCHDKQVYYLDNTPAWIPSENYYLFIINDGIIFGLTNIYPNCDSTVGTGRLEHNACNQLGFIDINGPSPPNKFGRDVFRFYLLNDGSVLPPGTSNDTRFGFWKDNSTIENCINTDTRGETCAARIMLEGWKMNY